MSENSKSWKLCVAVTGFCASVLCLEDMAISKASDSAAPLYWNQPYLTNQACQSLKVCGGLAQPETDDPLRWLLKPAEIFIWQNMLVMQHVTWSEHRQKESWCFEHFEAVCKETYIAMELSTMQYVSHTDHALLQPVAFTVQGLPLFVSRVISVSTLP